MAEERKSHKDKLAERREQILEAASAALARVGYEKITTRLIAQEANVNIATLHYHFGSKEALLAEAVRYALYRAERILRGVMEAASTPAGALAAASQAIWDIAKQRPGILRYDLVLRAVRDEEAADGILIQHLVTGDDDAAKSSLDLVRRHVLSLMGAGEGK